MIHSRMLILFKFAHQICTVLETIDKSFMFIGATEATTEVEDGIVIFKREGAEEFFQFLESVADLRWVGFVGFCVGLVELIQYGFAIAIAGIKVMGSYVVIQPLCNIFHISTPLCQ